MDFRKIRRAAQDQGWEVGRTGKGHWRFVPPDPAKPICIFSGTPSDRRAILNFVAQLRRRPRLALEAQGERVGMDGRSWYSVLVEAQADVAGPEIGEELAEALSQVDLPDSAVEGPAVSVGTERISARFSLALDAADDVGVAAGWGVAAFRAAAEKIGLPIGRLMRVEAVTEEELERELSEEPEQFVGVTEIARLLGVSKQRVSVLRTRPEFPAPVAELAAGPVWRLSSLHRFVEAWPRVPGRPAASR